MRLMKVESHYVFTMPFATRMYHPLLCPNSRQATPRRHAAICT